MTHRKRVLVPLARGFEETEAVAVVDGSVVTGRGVGPALELGLELAAPLVDRESAESVAKAIHFSWGERAR